MSKTRIGLLVFPDVTQLDLTAPLQVFSSVPDVEVHLVWKEREPVRTDSVMTLAPTTTFTDCPPLDVLCVPGGGGTDALLQDQEVLEFLRRQAQSARYVTSVCTGALVLGAAGLLRGFRATTHWAAVEHLAAFGAEPVQERVVVDRNRVSGGGVTAGMDFALTLVAELFGVDVAQFVQLRLEYDPRPPFTAGSPTTAPADVLADYLRRTEVGRARRRDAVLRASTA